MKRTISICLTMFFTVITGILIYVPDAKAQQYSVTRPDGRAGQVEITLPFFFTGPTSITGEQGSNADVHEGLGFGFGVGYNITDHFQINGLFSWSERNYYATAVQNDGTSRKFSSHLDTTSASLNVVYFLLSGNITPFVSVGVGGTYLDSNIAKPGTTSCWWDPWYGYVCNTGTASETDLSYNAGIGLRWDVNRVFSLQASYSKMWIDVRKAQGVPDLDVYRLDIIFRY